MSERVPVAFLRAASSSASRDGASSGGGGKKGASGVERGPSSHYLLSMFSSSSSSAAAAAANEKSRRGSYDSSIDDGGTGGGYDADEEAGNCSRFLFDFSYLHNPEEMEAGLSSSLVSPATSTPGSSSSSSTDDRDVLELERVFAVNHRKSIEEYYDLFYSIYEYQRVLNAFVEDLTCGYYIQYTVESVLLDIEGRALLCEAIWLYGVMLILMERLFPVSAYIT
jgi:hypothetical protein